MGQGKEVSGVMSGFERQIRWGICRNPSCSRVYVHEKGIGEGFCPTCGSTRVWDPRGLGQPVHWLNDMGIIPEFTVAVGLESEV